MLTFKDVILPPPGGQEKKISLNLSKFVPPPAPKPVVIPPKPKPVPVIPPTPQPVKKEPVKEIVTPAPVAKKKLLDEKKRLAVEKKESEENNVTKAVPKKEKKLVKKEVKKKPKKIVKKETKKRVVKRTKPKKRRRSKDPLANALMGSGTSMLPTRLPASRRASSGSYAAKMIKQLYGNEFNSFSPTQKKFIQDNLGTIHRITQRTLTRNGYPRVAVQTQQQGVNIVSFYLHPNGDITGLRLKRRMGYEALDQNTLDVIRIAYKNYPLPNKKTKIMFHVTYTLY